jgi:hypothetical protein
MNLDPETANPKSSLSWRDWRGWIAVAWMLWWGWEYAVMMYHARAPQVLAWLAALRPRR